MISVIMPVFNVEPYVRDSVLSVLNQTYTNLELIVVDDRSTDSTWAVVEEIAKDDPRLILCSNRRSKGVAGARNTGIESSGGEWIAFLDGDDLWYPESLEKRVSVAIKNCDCDVITTDYHLWFPDDDDYEVRITEKNPVWNRVFSKSNQESEILNMFNPVDEFLESALTHTSVVMIKSDLLKRIGGFDESLKTYEDVLLWLKLAVHSKEMIYIPVVCSRYRQRAGSLTHLGDPPTKGGAEMFKKILHDPDFDGFQSKIKNQLQHHLVINTYWYRNNGFRYKALVCAWESFISNPLNLSVQKNLIATILGR